MSSRQQEAGDDERPRGRPTRVTYPCRSVNPSGTNGADVNIPSNIPEEIGGLETGKGGDKVDLVWDRDERVLEIYFPDNTDE